MLKPVTTGSQHLLHQHYHDSQNTICHIGGRIGVPAHQGSMSQPRNYGIKTRSSSKIMATSKTTGMDTIHEESFVDDQATNTNETPL